MELMCSTRKLTVLILTVIQKAAQSQCYQWAEVGLTSDLTDSK